MEGTERGQGLCWATTDFSSVTLLCDPKDAMYGNTIQQVIDYRQEVYILCQRLKK